MHQTCNFFNRPQPANLWISFPDEPEVFLPNQPSTLNRSSSAGSVGLVAELSQFLLDIGAVVVGGATYLFGQDTDAEKPESSASYLNQVSQAYADAATDYLMRFNTQALSRLRQYQEIAEKVIIFQVTEERL